MEIVTEGPPIHQRSLRIPLLKRKIIDTEIDTLLAQRIIKVVAYLSVQFY